MVEIIKPGRVKAEDVFDATCRDCGCEFRFKRCEAVPINDRDGAWLKIDCPFCKATVFKNL